MRAKVETHPYCTVKQWCAIIGSGHVYAEISISAKRRGCLEETALWLTLTTADFYSSSQLVKRNFEKPTLSKLKKAVFRSS